MKADLEDAQRSVKALEADLDSIRQHVATLERENEHFRAGLSRCMCSRQDSE